jgi:hypothetical protein
VNSILETSIAFWRSAVFLRALKLNLFEKLGSNPSSAGELAELLGVEAEGLSGLLRALAGMKLLLRKEDKYWCPEPVLNAAIPGGERNLSHFSRILSEDFIQGKWSKFLHGGGGEDFQYPTLIAEPHPLQRLALAEQNLSLQGEAQTLVDSLDLKGKKRLLDIKGGSGCYGIALCRRYPGITAVLLEAREVAELARKVINENELDERIEVRDGDGKNEGFKDEFDIALLSNLKGREGGELIKVGFQALTGGGLMAVRGYFLDDSDERLFPALLDLNLRLEGRGDFMPEVKMVENWLKETGFSEIVSQPLTELSYLITAVKPPSFQNKSCTDRST